LKLQRGKPWEERERKLLGKLLPKKIWGEGGEGELLHGCVGKRGPREKRFKKVRERKVRAWRHS